MMGNLGRRRSGASRASSAKYDKQRSGDNPEVEALMDQGRRALERNDFKQAQTHFRQASAKSPFRQDIKDLLVAALSEREYTPMEEAAPEKPIHVRPAITKFSGSNHSKGALAKFAKPVMFGVVALALLFGAGAGIASLVHVKKLNRAPVKRAPESPEILAMIDNADRMSRQGRYVEAIYILENKARPASHDPANIDKAEAEVHSRQANILAEAKPRDFPGAIATLDKAIALQPQNASYRANKASYQHMQARLGESGAEKSKELERLACATAEEALKIDSNNELALWTLGRAYTALGDKKSASTYYQRLIAANPDSMHASTARTYLEQWGMAAQPTTQQVS